MEFFKANPISSRENLLTNFSNAMNKILDNNRELTVLIPGAGVTNSVGLSVFKDRSTSNLFVDIVNYNLDLDTDVMTATPALTFQIMLPEWMRGSYEYQIISPTNEPALSVTTSSPEKLEITVGPVQHYASVKITHVVPEPVSIYYLSFVIINLLFIFRKH